MGCGASKKKVEEPTPAEPAAAAAAETKPAEATAEAAVETTKTDLRKVFDQFDTDHDGTIDAKELRRAMKALNVQGMTVDEVFAAFKLDGEGNISLDEFEKNMPDKIRDAINTKITATGLVEGFRPLVDLALVFAQFDTDNSGKLDRSELRVGITALGMNDVDIDELIAKMDADGDGEIDLQEWTDSLPKEVKQKMSACLDKKGLIQGFKEEAAQEEAAPAAEEEAAPAAEEEAAPAAEEEAAPAEEE